MLYADQIKVVSVIFSEKKVDIKDIKSYKIPTLFGTSTYSRDLLKILTKALQDVESGDTVKVFLEPTFTDIKIEKHNKVFNENTEVTDQVLADIASQKGSLPKKDKTVFERTILSISLNGYNVSNPKGKLATNIEMTEIVSYIDQKWFDLLSNVSHQNNFHLDVHSLESAVSYSVHSLFPKQDHNIFVSGWIDSSILYFDSGVLVQSLPFTISSRSLRKAIMQFIAQDILQNDSYLDLYEKDLLDQNSETNILYGLRKIFEIWQKMQDENKQFSQNKNNMFLCIPHCENKIWEKFWLESGMGKDSITTMKPDFFSGFMDVEALDNDTRLASALLYAIHR